MRMRSIPLNEWALTILNQTIRADAEFQINQRSAWEEFSKNTELLDGIDIAAGFQHQRNLLMSELTFEFELVPDRPGLWDKIVGRLLFRPPESGVFYRLKKKQEQNSGGIRVRIIIRRDPENRLQQEVTIEPKGSTKAEDINVVGVAR